MKTKPSQPGETPFRALIQSCKDIIVKAEADGVQITDGNVVDLIADNTEGYSLNEIRGALERAGFAERFPTAVKQRPMSLNVSRVCGEISGIRGHEFFSIRRDPSSKGYVLHIGDVETGVEYLFSGDSKGWVHLTAIPAVPAAAAGEPG